MKKLGYVYRLNGKKGMYVDGHERDDVREHRRQYVVRMLELKRRADLLVFDRRTGKTYIRKAVLQNSERKVVFINQDESLFYR